MISGMKLQIFNIVIVIGISIITSSVQSRTTNSSSTTCDGELPLEEEGGFKLCLFGTSGGLVTGLVELVGNPYLAVLDALKIGKCFCNQNCSPSQIVCRDGEAIQNLTPDNSTGVLQAITQLLYNLENYQLYCYCPKLIPQGQKPCKFVPNPQKCPFPEDSEF